MLFPGKLFPATPPVHLHRETANFVSTLIIGFSDESDNNKCQLSWRHDGKKPFDVCGVCWKCNGTALKSMSSGWMGCLIGAEKTVVNKVMNNANNTKKDRHKNVEWFTLYNIHHILNIKFVLCQLWCAKLSESIIIYSTVWHITPMFVYAFIFYMRKSPSTK